MREHEVPVIFQPLGKTVHVLPGTRLMEAAASAGLTLDMPCGGEGLCNKCRVIVSQGVAGPGPIETQTIPAGELAQGCRLACQTTVLGPMTVEVPQTSLLGSFHKILAHTADARPLTVDPSVRKHYVELPAPERGSDQADLTRLQQAHGPLQTEVEVLRELPGRLRASSFRGTLVAVDDQLIDFEPGNTQAESFAVAVDVGTTTLAAMLIDLANGEQKALAARLNPQTALGDDVLSRILHAQSRQGLDDLQRVLLGALDQMIGELTAQAQIDRERIYEVTFAGNTTMQQLLLGIDPRPLGEVPSSRRRPIRSWCRRSALACTSILEPGLRVSGDRRLRGRRHGGGNPCDRTDRYSRAHPAGRYWDQRRDRALDQRPIVRRLHRRRAGL